VTEGRLRALASRDFRRFLIGLFISIIGTQMQRVAVAWQMYQLTGSAVSMGLLGLARVTPVLLFAVGGGVLADAFDRRRMMLVTQSALALSSVGLATLTYTGHVSPAVVYGAVALSGLASAFDAPARGSLVALLVPRADLPNALSLNGVIFELGTVIGPAVGGLLIGRWGVLPVYIFDALSFGAVIIALLGMSKNLPQGEKSPIQLSAVVDGLRFLGSNRLILSTMLLDFFATFFAGALLLLPIVADRTLAVGPEGLGILYAAAPVGASIAAVAVSWRGAIRQQGRVLIGSVVIYGAAIAAFGMSSSFPLALLFLAISGAADCVSTVIRQTMRHLLTPEALRGRMTSLNMMFFIGGPQLGELESGLVAGALGTRFAITSGGLLCIGAALATARFVPSLRHQQLSDSMKAP